MKKCSPKDRTPANPQQSVRSGERHARLGHGRQVVCAGRLYALWVLRGHHHNDRNGRVAPACRMRVLPLARQVDANGISNRAGAELLHHVTAMHLHRAHAEPELVSDHLVLQPGNERVEHLALAWGE